MNIKRADAERVGSMGTYHTTWANVYVRSKLNPEDVSEYVKMKFQEQKNKSVFLSKVEIGPNSFPYTNQKQKVYAPFSPPAPAPVPSVVVCPPVPVPLFEQQKSPLSFFSFSRDHGTDQELYYPSFACCPRCL